MSQTPLTPNEGQGNSVPNPSPEPQAQPSDTNQPNQLPQTNQPQHPGTPENHSEPAHHAGSTAYGDGAPARKKSLLWLWILLGILALLAMAGAVFFMMNQNKDKYASYEDFTSKVQEASSKGGADKCSNYSDTFLNTGENTEDKMREALAKEYGESFKNAKLYVCSSMDLTDISAAMQATEDPKINIGVYGGDDADFKKSFNRDNTSSDDTFKWGLLGKNWALIGQEPTAEEVQKITGGDIVNFEKK